MRKRGPLGSAREALDSSQPTVERAGQWAVLPRQSLCIAFAAAATGVHEEWKRRRRRRRETRIGN